MHAGYCRAAVQLLIDRLLVTVPEAERTTLQMEIMRIVLKEGYAELPLSWQVTPPYVYAKGITGPGQRALRDPGIY